jgi:peroxiredoxin
MIENMGHGRSTTWMRILVGIAALFNAYAALFSPDTLEMRAVWAALAIGLAIAAYDPLRYWLLILTAFLGRAFPAGVAVFTRNSRPAMPLLATAVSWLPLGFVLAAAYRDKRNSLRERSPEILDLALRTRTSAGLTIEALSREHPVLLVFLRHAGCTFCREAMADLARQRRAIEESGAVIVVAHMGKTDASRDFFAKYGLGDLPHISDPKCSLYKAFGLRRGNLWMLFGPKVIVRGFEAGILHRHGIGRLAGDGFQMPGIFMIFHGQVLRSYRHRSAADRPDYVRFVTEDAFTGMIS